MKQFQTISSALVLAALFLAPAAYAGEVIGVNSAVKGDVNIQTGEAEMRKAVVSDKIRLEDAVNTARSSTLQITLKDQTTFTVGPSCDLVIDKFVYDPAKADNTLSATVTKGMFRFMSGAISKSNPDAVSINTPVASLGIRGTIVEGVVGTQAAAIMQAEGSLPRGVEVNPEGASVITLRGPGTNRLGMNRVGRMTVSNQAGSVDVTRVGQTVFVPNAFTAPILVDTDSPSFSTFSDQLRTIPNGGPDTMAFNVSPNIPAMPTATAQGGLTGSTASGVGTTSGTAAGAGTAGAGTGSSGALALGTGTLVAGAVVAGGVLLAVVASGGDDDNNDVDEPVSN